MKKSTLLATDVSQEPASTSVIMEIWKCLVVMVTLAILMCRGRKALRLTCMCPQFTTVNEAAQRRSSASF